MGFTHLKENQIIHIVIHRGFVYITVAGWNTVVASGSAVNATAK